ncbi:MAG: hypothetical protein KBG48_30490 [Kofleriaceae bacterium]|jgi:hypothetical protein|nr:hypothetical protein [Kofleriaceae bacterium]MBP9171760.1 hypothetical protein [Kofleriaceae bacterium]MBP9856357.1 hypothetical protein [Kofleriaceae bacterium]
MRLDTLAMLGLMFTALGGCLESSDDLAPPDDPAAVDDDPTAPGPSTEPSQVVGTCTADRNCTGTKTCGAWSAWSTCGASYQRCDASCGFITRSGCSYQATVSPQNRSRTCTMRATGATCVEVDYREVVVSCPV